MSDRITANLPSRDFVATMAFYGQLGFAETYRDTQWMIIRRGSLLIEFFLHSDLDPTRSYFSACVRVADPDSLYEEWAKVGLSDAPNSIPRLTGFFKPGAAPRMFALIDVDGSLLRCMEDKE